MTQKRAAPVLNQWSINLDLIYDSAQFTALGFDADFVVNYSIIFGLCNAISGGIHYPPGPDPGEITIEHPNDQTSSHRLATQPVPYEMKPTLLVIRIGIIENVDAGRIPIFSPWEQVPLTPYTGARVGPGP
jgi:hypothetical protein